jgi:hypothetical protein
MQPEPHRDVITAVGLVKFTHPKAAGASNGDDKNAIIVLDVNGNCAGMNPTIHLSLPIKSSINPTRYRTQGKEIVN